MPSQINQKRIEILRGFVKKFQLLQTSVVKDGYTLYVNGITVGMIRTKEWNILRKEIKQVFRLDENKRAIHVDRWKTKEEITNGFAELLDTLRKRDVFPCLRGWRNELYEIAKKFGDEPIFYIERAATYIFGVKHYGVHVNGFVENDGKIEFVWLQRRSKTKQLFPGLLDIIVSGGLEAGFTPDQAVVKECGEEASISIDQCAKFVKPTGYVSFLYEDDFGTYPELFFTFDANLPRDFEPSVNDGEVEEFVKIEIDKLFDIIVDPMRFKVTSAPTVLDFLIRRHVIDSAFGAALFEVMEAIHQPLHAAYPVEK